MVLEGGRMEVEALGREGEVGDCEREEGAGGDVLRGRCCSLCCLLLLWDC